MNNLRVWDCTKEYYHNLLCKLDKDLRAFLDEEVEADKYYVVSEPPFSDSIVGAFATNTRGYLTGLFSLRKGYGKKIFELRLKKAILDSSTDVKYLELFCTGDKLRGFYENFGFKVVVRHSWNEDFAQKNWNYERFGKPKLYTMIKEIK